MSLFSLLHLFFHCGPDLPGVCPDQGQGGDQSGEQTGQGVRSVTRLHLLKPRLQGADIDQHMLCIHNSLHSQMHASTNAYSTNSMQTQNAPIHSTNAIFTDMYMWVNIIILYCDQH